MTTKGRLKLALTVLIGQLQLIRSGGITTNRTIVRVIANRNYGLLHRKLFRGVSCQPSYEKTSPGAYLYKDGL